LGNNYQGSDSVKKTIYPTTLISMFLVGAILACNLLTPPVKHSNAVVPTPTVSPTETSTPVPTATGTATPVPPTATKTLFPTATGISAFIPPTATATPQFAPFCEADTARQSQCQYPIAEQSSAYCEDKSPYNLIALNDRATYQLLHEHVQCSEAGVINGQRMIFCTGPMAYYFELRICDSACSALSTEIGSLRCPLGYNYNNLQDCCTQETQEVIGGCVVLKLRTKSCSIDCGQFTNSTTCTNYGYACRWNYEYSICQLRK
jgi:hypothetical protein